MGYEMLVYLDDRRISMDIAGSLEWAIGRAPVDDFALEDEYQEYVPSNFMTPGAIPLEYYLDDTDSAFEYDAGRRFTVMIMSKAEQRAPLYILGNAESTNPIIQNVVRDQLVKESDSLYPMGPTTGLGRSFWSQSRRIGYFGYNAVLARSGLPVNSTSGGTDFGADADNDQRGIMVAWRADRLDGAASLVIQRINVDRNGDETGRTALRTIALSATGARAGVITVPLEAANRVQRYGCQLQTGAGSTATDQFQISVYASRYAEGFEEMT
ncbi:MAG: hypothetical protein F4Z28_05075 [Gammaproteobacteria bacterium]|nr:hypothetical protein [Gammaproteobacteria bacterium]